MKSLGTPKLFWADEVKSKFNLKGQHVKKTGENWKLSLFLAIFEKSTGQKDKKNCTVHHIRIPYKCSLIKMFLSRKK